MIPTGYINLLYNEDMVNRALIAGDMVLCICDIVDERIYPSENLLHASLLLPPTECISFLIDESYDVFSGAYSDYLSSPEVDMYLLAIITGVFFKGSHLGIYMGSSEDNELQMQIFNVLYAYMVECFGIYIGTPRNQFAYDNSYDWFIISRMYASNLIDPNMFISNFPKEATIPPAICLKLTDELGLQRFIYAEEMIDYVNKYKNRCIETQHVLVDPLISIIS